MSDSAFFLGIIALALFVLSLALRKGDLAWMALPILAYLGLGLALSPPKEGLALSLRRAAKKLKRREALAGGGLSVEVSLEVRNEGDHTVFVSLHDHIRGEPRIAEGGASMRAAIRPGAAESLRYVFEADRGSYDWKEAKAKVGDPFGLFETEVAVLSEEATLVQPRVERIRPFAFRPGHTLSSPGPVPTMKGGGGTDFWGLREYQQGDPLKLLDWRLTARHPHRFFTRQFVEERTSEITLILDGRGGTSRSAKGESLFEIELRAVASICELLLRQGHRVGLIVSGSRILRAPPDFGKVQLQRILNCLAMADAGSAGSQVSLLRLSLGKISGRSTIAIMSPVDSEELLTFRRLRSLGFEVALICPDLFDFAGPILAGDRATSLALRASRLERRVHLSLISQLSVTVVDWRVGEPLGPLLRRAFGRRRKRGG